MNKRTVLAFVLAIAFFVTYQWFVLPRLVPRPAPPSETSPVAPAAGAPEAAAAPSAAEAPAPAQSAPEEAAAGKAPFGASFEVPEKYRLGNVSPAEMTFDTDLLTVKFTPKTGSIKSVVLKKFNKFDPEQPGLLELLTDFDAGRYPTEMFGLAGDEIGDVVYLPVAPDQEAPPGRTRVVFETILASGVRVKKTYTLYDGKYGLGLDIEIENLLAESREFSYEIYGPVGIPAEHYNDQGRSVQGVLAVVSSNSGPATKMTLNMQWAAALADKGEMISKPNERVNYAGAINQYFAAVLRPEASVPLVQAACFAVAGTKAGSRFEVGPLKLGPAGADGNSAVHSFLLYCGPKTSDALAAFDTADSKTGFSALLDYGWLDWFVKVILYLLRAFHLVIPNWGVAIILLTFLIRVLMHPLTKKSQVSMSKVQKLQPEIKKLQERYKNDKKQLGQEQMKLMKEAGANPLGGCLPMLVQLPIFFALYRALTVSIELRQAPFVLWIKDLAQPDRLFILPMSLPVIHNEFNLLPLLMLVAMVVQQRMMPKAATPEQAQQQKMMAFLMPVFLGAILYSLASGLNLYILTSSLFQVVEQWVIKRHIEANEKGAPAK